MWHRAIFPSEIHYEYQDKRRRDMAKLEEEKRKQDEFFAAENEKSLSQQIIDPFCARVKAAAKIPLE